jgi:lipopolysaccharide/colanic/teichoic acid biosynthesis glycosyltransferase
VKLAPFALYDGAKRIFDVVCAIVLLVISSPVQLAVALVVAARLGRPVLFRQERPGRAGRIFTLFKFRSMAELNPSRGLATDSQRLTSFGRKLRSTSLDELPTLINVLKGDMSIVGPRPLLVAYLERYTPNQARRLEVRPGITGLAQVSGRNSLSWDEKFSLDVHYVDERSFILDFRILWRTLASVVKREGITSEGYATTHEFRGAVDEHGEKT